MRFKFCPDCGNKLNEKIIRDEGLVPYCEECHKPLFDIFPACIIVLIVNEYGEAALLNQSYISDKYRNLVSGYIKPGETAEECAVRETEEELGIKIKNLRIIRTSWFDKKGILMIGFIAEAAKSKFILSDEVDSAEWIPVEKALNLVHPGETSSSYTLIKKYIDCKTSKDS